MTNPDRPFTFTIQGGRYWYFRSPETGVMRLPGKPEDPEFHRRYAELLESRKQTRAGVLPEGSFAWLINRYQKSAEYRALAEATQLDYARTLALLQDELGDQPYRHTTRAMLKAVRDGYAGTSRKANKIKQMLSRLYSWADECDLVPEGFNPAAGLRKVKRQGGEREYTPWSDPELEWAIKSAPPELLTPILIALYTGQRRRDVRSMVWDQWQGDLLRARTSKTRQLIDLPCHPKLKAHLKAVKRSRGAIPFRSSPICLNSDGQPWPSDNALSGKLRRFVEGHDRIPDNRSFHGIRYAAAARMNDGGADAATVQQVLGQRTFEMATKYASGRLRAKLGIAAMGE